MKKYFLKSLYLLVFFFVAISCKKNEITVNPIAIAHRGLYSDLPENSCQSFDECLKMGINSVEFDVYLTKDDSVLIIHDLNTEDIAGLSGEVGDFTAQELKKAVYNKSGAICLTFDEFYLKYKDLFYNVFIDLKEGQGEEIINKTCTKIANLTKSIDGLCNMFVTCTSGYPLELITKINPGIIAVLETSSIQTYLQSNMQFPYILIGFTGLRIEDSKIVNASGTRIITFTPNTVSEYKIALLNGCYAIMTDKPALLNDFLTQLTSD